MRKNSEDPRVVNSVDLILPICGEAVGGAEREYEYGKVLEKLQRSLMLKQIKAKGWNVNEFGWYLNNLKACGSLPHAGCGIGLSRITQFISGERDIRKATLFPLNRRMLL